VKTNCRAKEVLFQRQLHRLMSISEPLRAEWLKSLVGDLVEDLWPNCGQKKKEITDT